MAEWAAAFVQDPGGSKGTLIPVRVADFKPPGLLASIVYIDLCGKDETHACETLIRGIEQGRRKRKISFPGA
jgi:TIR domain-containing protein